jgi:hypothetical protein
LSNAMSFVTVNKSFIELLYAFDVAPNQFLA